MPIGNLSQCASIGQSAGCWLNYTFSNCQQNFTSLGSVFGNATSNTISASGVGTPAGIMCTITANFPYFWTVTLVFFYISLFFIYAVYPSKRKLLTIGGMGLILSTIMVSDGLIAGDAYVVTWVMMVLTVLAYRFLPTNG